MNKANKTNKPFPWRIYVFLIVVSIITIRTIWLWPRTGWLIKNPQKTNVMPQNSGTKNFSQNEIRRIVLISIDTCRADHFGCYGYSRNTTPNIDKLATDSVLFNHTISPVPITLPSHSTMLTGTTPLYHNVHDNENYKLSNSNVTLAEILKKNNFATAAIVSSFVLDKQFGLGQGFDSYNDNIEKTNMAFKFTNERIAEEVTTIANTWLGNNRSKKFFLFLHYYDPHAPFRPYKQFRFTSLPGITLGADRYDTEIAYTDHHIGKVIAKLKQLGLYDSTLIILTGDHGESLGQHEEKGHDFFIYHSTIHVPLMFKLPGSTKTARIDDVTGLVDIVPTICGLLGIDSPPEVQGQNLSVYFQKGQPTTGPKRYLYSESLTASEKYNAEPLHALVTNQYKYINTKRPELYDLQKDFHEADNIIKKQPEVAKELHQRLTKMLGQTAGNNSSNKIKLDAQSLKRLQSLGYVAGNTNDDLQSDREKEDPKDIIKLHNDILILQTLTTGRKYGPAKKLARKLIKQRPDFHGIHLTTLGMLLAKEQNPELRDSETAIFLLEHGAKVTGYRDHFVLSALAVAYGSAEDFDRAIKIGEIALQLSTEAKDYESSTAIRKLLDDIRAKKAMK